jgi:4-hydroxy-tetrahydrodipicolinate reductase
MGAAHRVDSVHGRTMWNVDDYGPEVAQHVHAGSTLAEFEAHVAQHGWPSFVVRNTVDAIIADSGLTAQQVTASVRPVLARVATPSSSLARTIEPGRLLGVTDSVTITTREGPSFSFEQTGCVFEPGQSDMNEWIVRGDPPELALRNDHVPTRVATCTQVVNRIPDVINAAPGFATVVELPRLHYRHMPLNSYI